jgi:hypothetical protein
MAKARGDQRTPDMFDVSQLFPVAAPTSLPKALDFNRRICVAMSEAARECGKTIPVIAAEMTLLLGYEDSEVTTAQLYAYTAQSREKHTISLVRFKAFVRATGCLWLWDVMLEGEGLTLLQGGEALHAQASLAEKHGRELIAQAKALREAAPLHVHRPRAPK